MTMIRSRQHRLVLPTGLGFALLVLTLELPSAFLARAVAEPGAASPTVALTVPAGSEARNAAVESLAGATDQTLSDAMTHTNAKGRHLAPRGTFYLLSYVSVTTAKGVNGFDPGQEVHLVEVHLPTHTLVVSDGHAQVEVPPSKLTNDMDIAAMVREKDEAKQARVAAYIQSEQTAYEKAEKDAAAATAKDLQSRLHAQAAQTQAAEQTPLQSTPQPVQTSNGDVGYNGGYGYYGEGGYGYGSPYSYLVVVPAPAAPIAPKPAPAAVAPEQSKVAAPGRRK